MMDIIILVALVIFSVFKNYLYFIIPLVNTKSAYITSNFLENHPFRLDPHKVYIELSK